MESMQWGGQPVTEVAPGSPADRAGLTAGETLVRIDGAPVTDVVDYAFLTANRRLHLTVRDAAGQDREVIVTKAEYEPLGLSFPTSLMSRVRCCQNRCVFCFVDQMPKGVRTSLSFKDDDWRLSFIMGNYVTLTNVPDPEFARILARRAGPLFVSVHATDPEVRARMMGNKTAGRILERLTQLRDAGIRFHAQIVLCQGWNDGGVLDRSLRDLAALAPAAQSVAIVPVGLTRFREGLPEIRMFTRDEAAGILDRLRPMQERWLDALGTRFAFLSDEWYILAGRALPEAEDYEDYPQIENGVGLLRQFEEDFLRALAERRPLGAMRRFQMAGGESAEPFCRNLYERLLPYNVAIETIPVKNAFFGGGVNVAGLVTGGDLVHALTGRMTANTLLIPACMLREREDVFLDDMTLAEAEIALGVRIRPVADGADLIEAVMGEEKE